MEEKEKTGLGCSPNSPLCAEVYDFLRLGSPRLALAKAQGVPFAPFFVSVFGTFDSDEQDNVLNQGSDIPITQDTFVDGIIVRVGPDLTPVSVFDPQSRFFDQYMNGIRATLEVQGTPRYAVAPKPIPLSVLGDIFNSKWPRGWLLTYQQQIFMSFFLGFPLKEFPTTVCFSLRCWLPVGEGFDADMPTREAIRQLREDCGYEIPTCYTTKCK